MNAASSHSITLGYWFRQSKYHKLIEPTAMNLKRMLPILNHDRITMNYDAIRATRIQKYNQQNVTSKSAYNICSNDHKPEPLLRPGDHCTKNLFETCDSVQLEE